ncbi:MAG: TatD family hydrolase [Elusimicrobia bacterium]|nr:TatD family hydrolase [Elusimicrobiota bacterium]
MLTEDRLFDSHAHLLDGRFDRDRDLIINGMGGIICMYSPGEDPGLFKNLLERKNVWGACGIHPHDAKDAEKLWKILEESSGIDKVVAVGETGLDFYYDNSPREVQEEVFRKHIGLAAGKKLPLIIHTRDAFERTMQILGEYALRKVLIHCFSGTPRQASECVSRGYYFGIGGVLTFPKASGLREAVKEIPAERILIETDCPYLAPQQVRGKRNQPSYTRYVAEELARVKDMTPEEAARETFGNTEKFFGLS